MFSFGLVFGALLVFAYLTNATPQVVGVTCVTRTGPSVTGISQVSSRICNSGETLVSCGIDGWQSIGGTYIENGVCKVIANHGSYSVSAKAVCCAFPSGSVVGVNTIQGPAGESSNTQCQIGTLTGCQVKYASGNLNQIQGSFTGPNSAPPQTLAYIPTQNRCNAYAKSGSGSTVIGSSQCVQFAEGYNLECKTMAKYTTRWGYGYCPTGYEMFGCNTYTTSATLDDYWVDNGQCYVQQDSYKDQYANAICCQLTRETCDMTQIGVGCEDDSGCPDCMICCKGRKTCHLPVVRRL